MRHIFIIIIRFSFLAGQVCLLPVERSTGSGAGHGPDVPCPLSLVQRCLLILQLLILFHAVYANEVQKDKAKTAAAEAATRHQLSQHLDIKIISE